MGCKRSTTWEHYNSFYFCNKLSPCPPLLKREGEFYSIKYLSTQLSFKYSLNIGIIFAAIFLIFCSPSLLKRRGRGKSLLFKKKDKMLRTYNLILLQAAKDLSRELRKSQTKAEKLFWENVRKKRLRIRQLT